MAIKTFMILGASVLQIPLIRRAREMGYAPVVVSPFKADPGFEYATHAVYADVRDEEAILAHAKKHHIAGIATDQTDLPVTTAAYVAEKMNLPGIGYDVARLFTNKYLMREKCESLGIPTTDHRLVRTPAEALAFFDALKADVIVKPVDNQGSRGISKVPRRDQVKEKFNQALHFSKSKSVLMERYITGREFVVEGMACDGAFCNLAWGNSYYFSTPDTFTPSSRVFPAIADKITISRILKLNEKVVVGFGLKNGITHSEYIMDHNGDIFLIETAARGGGMFISSDIIPLLSSINTEEFLVHIAAGTLERVPEIKWTGLVCGYVACVLPAGEVVSVKGVEKIQSLPYIRGNNMGAIRAGMKTIPFTDKTSRYFAVLVADNHRQFIERVQQVRNALHVTIKTETGIQGALWE